jgi:hypothetical protein
LIPSEQEDVAFYELYDDYQSSRNTPLLNSSQLRDLDEGSEPEGDEGGNTNEPAVEETDTDQHTTNGNSPEHGSEGGKCHETDWQIELRV